MGARPIVNIPTPTAAWPLNGTGTDVIGGNTLTWAGTTRYDSIGGGNYGAFMDGGEYLKSTSPILSGRTFTIEFKLRFDAGSIKTTTSLFSQHSDGVAGRMFMAYSSAGTLRVQEEGNVRTQCAFTPVVGKEYHIVFTMSNGSGNWYIQGRKQTLTVDAAFSQNIAAVSNVIGRYNAAALTANDFHGLWYYAQVWNGTAFTDAQAAELYVRSKAPVQNPAMLKLVSGGTIPVNRANELFFTHNFSRDLSVNDVAITRIGGAKITRDGLLCDGASGGASIADKIGTGDITIYTTIYPTTLGEGSSGVIMNNGKFHARILTNNVLSISSDDSTFAASANNALSLLVPIRLCITRTAAGVVNAWKNGTTQIITDGASGSPVAASTDLYFGNRAADDRTFAGLQNKTRINSGIDTAAQRVADNARYGFK